MGDSILIYQVVAEYRAWQSYNELLYKSNDMLLAVNEFVKEYNNQNSIVCMDGPEIVFIIYNSSTDIVYRYASRHRQETVDIVLYELEQLLSL
ncbi:hypothetical protein D3C71_1381580 [compost metagenome]